MGLPLTYAIPETFPQLGAFSPWGLPAPDKLARKKRGPCHCRNCADPAGGRHLLLAVGVFAVLAGYYVLLVKLAAEREREKRP